MGSVLQTFILPYLGAALVGVVGSAIFMVVAVPSPQVGIASASQQATPVLAAPCETEPERLEPLRLEVATTELQARPPRSAARRCTARAG